MCQDTWRNGSVLCGGLLRTCHQLPRLVSWTGAPNQVFATWASPIHLTPLLLAQCPQAGIYSGGLWGNTSQRQPHEQSGVLHISLVKQDNCVVKAERKKCHDPSPEVLRSEGNHHFDRSVSYMGKAAGILPTLLVPQKQMQTNLG